MRKSKILKISMILVLIFTLFLANKTFVLGLLKPKIPSGDIQIIIKPEYENYLVNQSLWLKVIVINKTGKSYQLKTPLDIFGMKFEIIGPDNIAVQKIFESERAFDMDSIYVSGNDSIENFINLDFWMHNSLQLEKKLIGKYIIRATYQGMESNELNIRVEYPSGGDKELFDQTFGAIYPFSNDDQSKKLENLLNQYSKSPYGPQLYDALFVLTPDQTDTSRFISNYQNYFDNYSDTYSTIVMLRHYKHYLGSIMKLDKNHIDSRIQQLETKHQGKFIERCIKNDNFINLKNKFK